MLVLPILLAAGVVGLVAATRNKTPQNLRITPIPEPTPSGPPQVAPGELARVGDIVNVPVSFLYPRGVPFDPTAKGTVQFGPNDVIDEVEILLNAVGAPGFLPGSSPEVAGVTVGFTFKGPGRSGGTSIPERIPTPFFSRGAITRVSRNGVLIAGNP